MGRSFGRCSGWYGLLTVPLVALALGGLSPARESMASPREVASLLQEMQDMSHAALRAAEAGAEASTIPRVKAAADSVYFLLWGISSGLADEHAIGAARAHGWKERWQTDETRFDSAYAVRYSGLPPRISDPRELGIIGRGRHARRLLDALIADSTAPAHQRMHADHVRSALNNVIGWMQMDTGRIKNEIQPRVDLTRLWDAPVAFWNSTSDTGWAFEVLAQAMNILKVHYTDVAEARTHARAMADLIRAYIDGRDVDGDGRTSPVMMEGGLITALEHAGLAGFDAP